MHALGEALDLALREQGWLVLRGEYGMISATSPRTVHMFLLDDSILEDEDLQEFLQAQISMMVRYGGLIWPWPPRAASRR